MVEIKNVRKLPTEEPSKAVKVWENLQYLNLALTIIGQITVGAVFLVGQGVWLLANVVAVARDIALKRPHADLVRDAAMLAITAGIIAAYFLGAY